MVQKSLYLKTFLNYLNVKLADNRILNAFLICIINIFIDTPNME